MHEPIALELLLRLLLTFPRFNFSLLNITCWKSISRRPTGGWDSSGD